MAKPKKLPSGNWNCTVFSHRDENGKRHYVSFTAATKVEAARQAAEYQANKSKESSPQDLTVMQVVENYISSKSNILSPSTLKEYKNYLKYYKPIGNIRIGSLSSVDVQNFINVLAKDKSAKTTRNIYSLLASAIRLYSDRNFRVTLPSRALIERNIPTDDDVKKLLENASSELKKAILLAGIGGLRRGEICALKYEDVLYDFNAVYVHSDMVLGESGWIHKPIPKTSKSTRRVELPPAVIEALGNGDPDEYVIKVHPSTITTDFVNLRNRLGLKCRFHDLRHYATSILHAIGVPDVYIQDRMGWESDRVMKDVYRNVLADKSSHFTSIANEYFEDSVLHGVLHSNTKQKK